MASKKSRHPFSKGLHKDSDKKQQPQATMRDAVNMDLVESGDIRALKNLKGTAYLSNLWVSSNVTPPPDDANILGVYETFGEIDLDGDLVYDEKRCLVAFLYDSTNGGRIQLYDLEANASYTLKSGLDFPPEGTVDAFLWKEKEKNQIIFADHTNELRIIDLRYSTAKPLQSDAEISLRPYAPVDKISYVSVQTGGSLLAGTYQIGYRYFNTDTGKYTAWSLLTNPIPITPDDYPNTTDKDEVIGGVPGQQCSKSIEVSIAKTVNNSLGFDSIQLVVVKNVVGDTQKATIAYKLSPSKLFYTSPSSILYDGSTEETEIALDEVVVEDAPLISAKTVAQKDNRLFAGNIKYQDFKYDNGDPVFNNAKTIKQALGADAYKNEDDTVNYKGYWRDEVYRFGITYMDKFGNWSPVEPFDFSDYKWDSQDTSFPSQIIVSTAYSAANDQTTVRTFGLFAFNNLSKYDYIRVFVSGVEADFQIISVNTTGSDSIITVRGDASGAPNGSTVRKLLGHAYNNGGSSDWRFPARSNHEFSILNTSDEVEAIGLRIEGIQNHPSWAKAFAIVRMPRRKNIIYQSPHIPIVAVQGVPSPGYPVADWDYGEVIGVTGFPRDARDTVYVKKHAFGAARNIYHKTGFYSQPEYATQGASTNNENAYPNGMILIPPAFIYNFNGEPISTTTFDTSKQIKIVDAIALEFDRKVVNNTAGDLNNAFIFKSLSDANYYYNRDGFISDSGSSLFFEPLTNTAAFTNGEAVELSTVTSGDYFVLNHPFQITGLPLFPNNTQYQHITRYGALTDLSTQQGQDVSVSNSISATIVNFGQPVENQRAVLLQSEDGILDFSYRYAYEYQVNSIDYFPGTSAKPQSEIYDNTHLTVTASNPAPTGNFTLAYGNSNGDDYKRGGVDSVDGDIASAAYIVNVEAGLGDNRYGSDDTEQTYIFTGVYQVLTTADIANNTSFDIDIFGGDCFVTKTAIKVSNSNALPIRYNPDDTTLSNTLNDVAKVGTYQNYVEILELYLESEVNAGYHAQRYGYPYNDTTGIDNYSQDYDYTYSRDYSKEAEAKNAFSFDLGALEQDNFPARIIYSDQKVYNSNVFGFDRFRVNNVFDLEETYGGVTKLVTQDNGELFSLQEMAVRYIPVNKVQTQLQDGTTQFVGTSNVIGSSINYITRSNGTQHIRSVTENGGYVYFADARNREVYRMRGANIERISDIGMYSYFRDQLTPSIPEKDLQAHFDFDRKEYILTKQNVLNIVFNERMGLWKTFIDTGETPIARGVYAFGDVYWLNTQVGLNEVTNLYDLEYRVNQAYVGDRGQFFGVYNNSSVEVILNPDIEVAKTFDVITVNGINRFDNLDAETFYEDSQLPNQIITSLDVSSIEAREGRYHINKLRGDNRSARMRGTHMRLGMEIENNADNKEVTITELILTYRPSSRF